METQSSAASSASARRASPAQSAPSRRKSPLPSTSAPAKAEVLTPAETLGYFELLLSELQSNIQDLRAAGVLVTMGRDAANDQLVIRLPGVSGCRTCGRILPAEMAPPDNHTCINGGEK